MTRIKLGNSREIERTMNLKDIEKELASIKERNKRVEADKTWETSWFRVLLLSIAIYIAATLFLYFQGVSNYWFAGLVPAIGYFLSTQSLPFYKKVVGKKIC